MLPPIAHHLYDSVTVKLEASCQLPGVSNFCSWLHLALLSRFSKERLKRRSTCCRRLRSFPEDLENPCTRAHERVHAPFPLSAAPFKIPPLSILPPTCHHLWA